MKRVVVTGATGFLGRPTADRLRARGWEVVGVSRSGDGDTRRVNLLDPSAVRALFAEVRPSHLLHAAWQPVRGNVMQSPENVEWLAASLALVRTFQECGVDQTIFIQQSGRNRHEDICESLELFASDVMPEFAEREAERERAKREALAPYVEAAMARKQAAAPLAEGEIPMYEAYGNTIALTDEDIRKLPEGNRRRVLTFRKIKEIAERA